MPDPQEPSITVTFPDGHALFAFSPAGLGLDFFTGELEMLYDMLAMATDTKSGDLYIIINPDGTVSLDPR